MFTSQQNVHYWAKRLKYTKQIKQAFPKNSVLPTLCRLNYAWMLIAAFSVLFNERLKQSGRVI